MSYTVLARRYRSRTFSELIGQEPIARTLENAIASDRTAHAYLFCGTRGVGKTSLARLFARAINVVPGLEQAEDIGEAILRGEDLDVIEIDGASNRGIQEAKDLIAGSGLSPARCPYKIYIIDEVHALTRDAFNALLKTMEEPPRHVKFILCTTEPQKVPPTIQSRCQRFDFRAISTAQIAAQLARILETEGIEADEAVVAQVARLGNGSMRDALSLLDRLIAGGEAKLTVELAEQMLGLPDHALLTRLMDAVVARDPKTALAAGADLLAGGATVSQALEMLAEHLRTLMLVIACGVDSELVEGSPEAVAAAQEQARHFDLAALVYMIALCDSVSRNARDSTAARALLDAAVVRLCLSEHFADVTEALASAGAESSIGAASAAGKKKGESGAPSPAPASSRPAPPSPASRPPVPPALRHRAERGDEADTSASAPLVEVKAPAAMTRADEPIDGARLWHEVVDFARSSPKDQARVGHLEFGSFDGKTLHLAVTDGAPSARYLARQADSVADLVRRATGRTVRVSIAPPRASGPAEDETSPPQIAEVRDLPVVRRAVEIFDATVVDVRDETTPPVPPLDAEERKDDV